MAAVLTVLLWRAFNNSSAPSLGIEFRSASSKVLPEHSTGAIM